LFYGCNKVKRVKSKVYSYLQTNQDLEQKVGNMHCTETLKNWGLVVFKLGWDEVVCNVGVLNSRVFIVELGYIFNLIAAL